MKPMLALGSHITSSYNQLSNRNSRSDVTITRAVGRGKMPSNIGLRFWHLRPSLIRLYSSFDQAALTLLRRTKLLTHLWFLHPDGAFTC